MLSILAILAILSIQRRTRRHPGRNQQRPLLQERPERMGHVGEFLLCLPSFPPILLSHLNYMQTDWKCVLKHPGQVTTPPHARFQDALAFTRSCGDLHLQVSDGGWSSCWYFSLCNLEVRSTYTTTGSEYFERWYEQFGIFLFCGLLTTTKCDHYWLLFDLSLKIFFSDVRRGKTLATIPFIPLISLTPWLFSDLCACSLLVMCAGRVGGGEWASCFPLFSLLLSIRLFYTHCFVRYCWLYFCLLLCSTLVLYICAILLFHTVVPYHTCCRYFCSIHGTDWLIEVGNFFLVLFSGFANHVCPTQHQRQHW